MNKQLLLFVLILFFATQSVFAQYFEGVIIYKMEYTPYDKTVTVKELEKSHGTIREYYVKDGNYKSVVKSGGAIIAINTFRHAEHKMYTQSPIEPEVILWNDYKKVSDTLVKAEIKEKYDVLMGETCDLLTMEHTSSVNHYLLSNKYRINPAFFQEHLYDLVKEQMNLSGGRLPLEIVNNHEKYGVVQTALSVTEQKIDNSFFDVDQKKIFVPRANLLEKLPEPVGGLTTFYKHINQSIRYPKEARRKGVEGRVLVNFIVDEQGNMSHLKIISGIGYGCNEEVERITRNFNGKWEPGMMDGQKVKTYLTLPVVFSLR